MANTRKVTVEVTDNGTLKQVAGEARKLNDVLDRTAQPRKVQTRAASAALSASGGIGGGAIPPTSEGLGRGTAGAQGRGDARDFSRQSQGLGGLVHLYATFAANIYAVTAAFNAMSKAADFTNMQKAADILSLKVGTSINSLAKDMQSLTDGAISMSEALGSASLATSAGLTVKQIKELTSVAKGASIALGRDMTDAMTRVFRGTIKIEPELLDELGLMVKVDDANKEYAKTLGKTATTLTDYERRQAFVNAVTTQGIRKYKELADQASNPFSKLAASLKDLSTSVLVTINSSLGPLISLLSESPTALLLAMTAIVGLLLKQAIPAIGNMQAAWEATDKAAQQSLSKQREALEAQKKAVLDLNEAKVTSAQQAFVKTRDLAIKELENSGIKKSRIKGIDNAAKLGNFIGLSEEQIKTQTEAVRKELENTRRVIQAEVNKTQEILDRQGKKSGKTFLNAKAEIGRLNNELAAIQNFEKQGLQAISGAATAQALVQKNLMTTDAEITNLTNKIGKFEQMGQRLAVIRGAVQATEAGGFRLGFTDLFDSIKKGAPKLDEFGNITEGVGRKFSALEKTNIALKGSFQVLTVGISRLLGTFSIWMAVFTVLIPLVGWVASKLGLVSEALGKLDEATEKVNTTTKTFLDIQEKLSKTGTLAEQYELQAGSALALADSIAAIVEQQEKLQNLRDNGTWLDKVGGGLQKAFGMGSFDEDTELQTVKVYEQMVKKGLISKNAVGIDTSAIGKVGSRYRTNLTTDTFERASGLEQSNAAELARLEISAIDPKLRKELEEFNKSSTATTNNLKELSTISTEYSISLVNQSKELKALNSLGSSASATVKNFAHRVAGSAATLQNFLKGITSDFQQLAGTNLGPTLTKLTNELAQAEADAGKIYDTKVSQAKNLPPAERAKVIEKAETDRTASLEIRQKQIVSDNGGISAINSEIAKYSISAATKLGEFSKATAAAALAQANVAKKLRALAIYTSGSDRSSATQGQAESQAARERVEIERRTIRTNKAALESQRTIQEQYIKSLPGFNSASGNTLERGMALSTQVASEGASKEEIQAIEELKSKSLSATMSLISLGAQLGILDLNIKTLYASLDSKDVSKLKESLEKSEDNKNVATKAQEIYIAEASNAIEEEFSWIDKVFGDTTAAKNMKEYREDILSQYDASVKASIAISQAKDRLDAFTIALAKIAPGAANDIDRKGAQENVDKSRDDMNVATAEYNKVQLGSASIDRKKEMADLTYSLELYKERVSLVSKETELLSQINTIIDTTSNNFNQLLSSNNAQVSSLQAQLGLEVAIANAEISRYQASIKARANSDTDGKQKDLLSIEEQRQKILSAQLSKVEQMTDLYKEQRELVLKVEEAKGPGSMFSDESLTAALGIMADRIQETMGKTKATMSQLATGLVDSADVIVDSFATMIQKMDETKLSWVSFRDMVRNTLSDMFRNMASDVLKNAIKQSMMAGIGKFTDKLGLKPVKTAQELAQEALGTNLKDNATKLLENTQSIQALTTAINTKGMVGAVPTTATATTYKPQNIDKGAISDADLNAQYDADWAANKSASINNLQANSDRALDDIMNNGSVFEDASADSLKAGSLQQKASSTLVSAGSTFDFASNLFSNSVPTLVNGIVSAVSGGGGSLRSVGSSLLPTLFSSMLGSFAAPANIAAFSSMPFNQVSAFSTAFEKGGIMSSMGSIPLNTYAKGGIADSPQVALFGEGRKNEAYVPLPDNRTIPVTLSGGGGANISNGDTIINVKITNGDNGSSSSVDVEQSKKFSASMAAAVKATVQEELIKQMRPRGLLNA